MARKLRRPEKGAIYHLIAKGNQGDFIFDETANKEYFIECLKKAVEDYQARVYAYCIMGNHYHVVLQNTEANLSEIMHYVGSSFASRLRDQGRIGHIFSGRYKSIHLEGRERLLSLSKYVHLNPVRASIVERPEDYDWSSYRFFAWDLEPPDWLYVDWAEEHFKPDGGQLRRRYREFVENDTFLQSRGRESLMTAQVIVEAERYLQDIMQIDREDRPRDENRLDAFQHEVCRHFGIESLFLSAIKSDQNKLRLPRRVFAYVTKEFTLASYTEIVGRLGIGSPSRVTQLHRELLGEMTQGDQAGDRLREEVASIVSKSWTPHDRI